MAGRNKNSPQGSEKPPEADGIITTQLASILNQIQKQSEALDTLSKLPEAVKVIEDRISDLEHNVVREMEDWSGYQPDEVLSDRDPFDHVLDNSVRDKEDTCDLLNVLGDNEITASYGPAVASAVAEGLLRSVSRQLPKESADALKSTLKVPENCKNIGVPKVNPEIWNSLPNNARMADLRDQQVQQIISYGLLTMTKIAETVANTKTSSPTNLEIMTHVKTGSNILGQGFYDLTLKRRTDLRSFLAPDYAGICAMKDPATEFLFGDCLDDQLKKSKATSELVRKVSNVTRGHISKPYDRSKYLNYKRPSSEFHRRGGQFRGHYTKGWRGQKRGQDLSRQYHHPPN